MSPKEKSMFKERETYTPTKGVENEGYEFEVAMLSYYGLHLCYNSKIKNFKIAIYDDHYHPFDDVVINVKTPHEEKYAFQLKHVKDKLHLNPHHFGKNGKMVLSKYFKYDFSKSDHVVLFTNGVVKEDLAVGSYSIKPKQQITLMEQILDTCAQHEEHIFEITSNETRETITFYTSQRNRTAIEAEIKNQFKRKFSIGDEHIEAIYQKYKRFFQMWKNGHYEICKLDKQDIKMKIAEILFYDCIVKYDLSCAKKVDGKTQLLQQLLNSFDVSLIRENFNEAAIHSLCQTGLTKDELIGYGKKFLIISNNESCFDNKLEIVLWHLRKLPLIVKVVLGNKPMILDLIEDLSKENLSFVLIGDCFQLADLQNLKTFQNLNDLDYIYEDVIKCFQLSIQGQAPISLKDLVSFNPSFKNLISLRELILMLEEFCVDEVNEVLPKPYVPRRLLLQILKIKCIEQFSSDVFVISGQTKILKSKLRKSELCYYDRNVVLNSLPPKTVVMCEDNAPNCFISLMKYKRNVHWLKVLDDDHFQLIKSKKHSEKLKKLRVVREDQLFSKVLHNVNLVCARPGMGKLTLLKYLRKNCPPGFWTVKVDLQENQNVAQDTQDKFASEMRRIFQETKRLIFFFYGFDNLHVDKLEKAVHQVQSIANKGFQVWVFANDHLKEILEKILEISSISIEEFNEDEQRQYIQDRLKEINLDQNFEKVLGNFKMLKNNDILGAPMHLYMLTEVFINNPKAKIEDIFILTDIYQYFIKTKYQHYLKKINNCYHQNQLLDDGTYYRTQQYKLAAASGFFNKADIQCDPNFIQQIKSKGDVIGVILKINESGTFFSQQTYADYFAALWLADNYSQIGDLDKVIFTEEFKNILFMFNLELTKRNPAHIAVLYQNHEHLEKHVDKLREVDVVGRSPLHLACAFGVKYSKSDDIFRFKESIEENSTCKKITAFLIESDDCDPLQEDKFLGWNCLDYAFSMLNLFAVEKILTKYPHVNVTKSSIFQSNFSAIAYFAVKFGHTNLVRAVSRFQTFQELIGIENCRGETLLHTAVKLGNLEIVKILVEKNSNINRITSTFHKRSPLHLAVQNGHYDVVEFLTGQEAVVDVMDRHRSTPLHLAASKADLRTAKLLVQLGADVNFSDNFGRRPVHRAAASGHLKLLEFLIKNGAEINPKDRLGQTPIHYAFHNQKSNAIKLLLKNGASNTCLGISRRRSQDDCESYTNFPMHWAAVIGHLEGVERLLEDNFPVDCLDTLEETPLHLAVLKRHTQIVKILLKGGADVNRSNDKNITSIFYAINNQDVDLINLLLDHGADLHLKDYHQRTPLHWSAVSCSHEILKLILGKNPERDVTDQFGRKPVDYAAESGNYEVIRILEDNKNSRYMHVAKLRHNFFEAYENVSYNIKSSSLTLSPFLNAIDTGNVALIKKFLIQECNVCETDDFGYAGLHRAVVKEHKEVVCLLLEENAKLDRFDQGITLLHFATYVGNCQIVEALVRHGAKVNDVDDFGYSSLHLAAMKGHPETLSFLINCNGDFNKTDKFGNTLLDWGCKEGHLVIVELLERRNAAARTIQEDYLDMAKAQSRFFEMLKVYFTRL